LRLVAGLLVAFVAMIGLFIAVLRWRISPHHHDLGGGQTLREVLAGQWDWSTGERPCTGDQHTIAFADSGRVMIIRQSQIDSATGAPYESVYDIVAEEPSIITGAIRNEKRLTDDGKPVVWELILTSPHKYTWRRTDWARWSSTASIIRCR
jgi:hypothetical protein